MNFKNILGFATLALFGMANAIPVDSSSRFEHIIQKCKNISGIPLLQEEGTLTYACLVKYNAREDNAEVNPNNSYCFKNGKDSILCIPRDNTNIITCDKQYRFTDEGACFEKIRELTNTSDYKLPRPVVSFPDGERFVLTPREDFADCKNKNGIIVKKEDSMFRYICFVPEGTELERGKTHCCNFDGKRYCIEENLTSTKFCNANGYDAITCLHFIVEYAVENNVLVSNFK